MCAYAPGITVSHGNHGVVSDIKAGVSKGKQVAMTILKSIIWQTSVSLYINCRMASALHFAYVAPRCSSYVLAVLYDGMFSYTLSPVIVHVSINYYRLLKW